MAGGYPSCPLFDIIHTKRNEFTLEGFSPRPTGKITAWKPHPKIPFNVYLQVILSPMAIYKAHYRCVYTGAHCVSSG